MGALADHGKSTAALSKSSRIKITARHVKESAVRYFRKAAFISAKVTLLAAPPAGARLRLRVPILTKNGWVGNGDHGEGSRFALKCHHIRSLKHVVSVGPKSGLTFALDTAKLEEVDARAYFLHHRQGRAASVIASMASIPSRRAMMRDTVESLLLQCDIVRVFLNEYPDVPSFLNHPRGIQALAGLG